MEKRTPLYEEHVRLGATIVPFAGWEMPVYYTSVMDEHNTTRQSGGLFDTSHMGEFDVKGPKSFNFIQSLITNDMRRLEQGKAIYTVLPNERGGCVDDLWVYMIAEDDYMLCVNAGTKDKDFAWIKSRTYGWDVQLADRSDDYGMVALQGQVMKGIIAKVSGGGLPERFCFKKMEVAGMQALVSRTGYTGEDGVEIYVDSLDTVKLWNALLDAGGPLGLKPVGLGARDTLRLEACYSLYGHELTEEITPVEAGISFAVARDKEGYPGCDVIRKQLMEGTERKIIAFELMERGVPREHCPVLVDGEKAGEVTSGTFSPMMKKGIGLAMLAKQYANAGQDIEVDIRGKFYAGRVVNRPFIQFRGGI